MAALLSGEARAHTVTRTFMHKDGHLLDLDSFLVSLYVLVDDWWQGRHQPAARRRGRPALLTESEILTLAVLAQWPRWRSERDFWRFASAHLRGYFPNLVSQGQLNRRIRILEPELRALQRNLQLDEQADHAASAPLVTRSMQQKARPACLTRHLELTRLL